MGIYSEIINSCHDLGSEYVGYLQTKDLDGVFDQYWIAPNGYLFKIYWPALRQDGCIGFEPCLNGDRPHGRVSPFRFTGLIVCTTGPALCDPKRPVWFINGRLMASGLRFLASAG